MTEKNKDKVIVDFMLYKSTCKSIDDLKKHYGLDKNDSERTD